MRTWFSLIPLVCLSLFVSGCSGHGSASSMPPVTGVTPVPPDAIAPSSATVQTGSLARLASYNVDPAKVFVAGISSGGFFAVQMHVAHSSTFKGAAIYAGGVFYCAQDSIAVALAACGGEGLYAPTLVQSEAYLDLQSSLGTIDPEADLRAQPVYLWQGLKDTIVNPNEMNDLDSEYVHYGARIVYDNNYPAQHGWESPDGELACGTAASPYIIKCDNGTQPYDSEHTWLKMFFGNLRSRNNGTLRGTVINFDQTEFGASASNSMDTNGYVFVPRGCSRGATCALVVAFHGCLQTQADIGTRFLTEGGIDKWADTNHIIVLYPFTVKSSTAPLNPNGCWDWWGYDDPNYALKSGTQVSIVYKMVQRLMGGR